MTSEASRLDPQREKQILKLFPRPARLVLLCKRSSVGSQWYNLNSKCDNEGKCVIVIYMKSGAVRGVYMKETIRRGYGATSDEDAFVFEASEQEAIKYPVLEPQEAAVLETVERTEWLKFGDAIRIKTKNVGTVEFDGDGNIYTDTCWSEGTEEDCEIEIFRVQDVGRLLPTPWRTLSWSEKNITLPPKTREDLLRDFVSFRLSCEDIPQVRVLLLGPVGAGKSSFIISARSVMYNRVTHMPIAGNTDDGFTKKLTSYNIRDGKGGFPTALTLCDVMAINEEDSTGLSLSDTLAIIKGHVPEGYKFQSNAPFSDKVTGYRANPSLKEKIHCVLFVLDASKITSYSSGLRSNFRKLRSEISDLCIPQMILLTHIDQVCHAVQEDVKHVYISRNLQETMEEAAKMVHMPVSCVLPIMNYVSGYTVDCNMDILLLSAFNHILQAVDDALEDQETSSSCPPDDTLEPLSASPDTFSMESE